MLKRQGIRRVGALVFNLGNVGEELGHDDAASVMLLLNEWLNSSVSLKAYNIGSFSKAYNRKLPKLEAFQKRTIESFQYWKLFKSVQSKASNLGSFSKAYNRKLPIWEAFKKLTMCFRNRCKLFKTARLSPKYHLRHDNA